MCEGRYELGAMPVGVYDVKYELAPFGTEKRRVEAAFRRFPGLVMSLAYFKSAAADRLAERYLKTDAERDEYNRLQSDSRKEDRR